MEAILAFVVGITIGLTLIAIFVGILGLIVELP